MPSLDALLDSEFVLVAAAACMLGGFHLAGFFKAKVFEGAPDRSGVVESWHLLVAAGFLAPQIARMVLRCFFSSSWVESLGSIAALAWPLAFVFWMWLGFLSPENVLRLGIRGNNNGRSARVGLWGIPAGLILVQGVSILFLILWALLGEKEPAVGHEVFKNMQERPHDVFNMVVNGVFAVLLAPLFEEAMFRGLLQTGLSTWLQGRKKTVSQARWISLGVVGLVFGAIHWGAVPPPMLPALVALGFLLGWAYEYTGCFWVPVAIHMGFNAVSFAAGVWQIRHP